MKNMLIIKFMMLAGQMSVNENRFLLSTFLADRIILHALY